MKAARWLVLPILLVALVSTVLAQTEVTSITASPDPFNAFNGESTTFTVQASPGMSGMEIRVLSSDQMSVVRSGLTLTESSSGVYTTVWNGRNNNNAIVAAACTPCVCSMSAPRRSWVP